MSGGISVRRHLVTEIPDSVARLHLSHAFRTRIERLVLLDADDIQAASLHLLRGFVPIEAGCGLYPTRSGALMAALLAFDTSGERLHIGVSVDEAVWIVERAGGPQASANLIPCLRHVLDQAGIGLRELDAIAFGRGPGAFAGLRAASSAAQGLAWGASLPVLPIDTLMAVAEDARVRVGADDVWVAMDARMGEIFAGRYQWSGANWVTHAGPMLVTPDGLSARCLAQPAKWLAGSAPRALGDRLQCHHSASIDADAKPAARALLACGRMAWARGEAVDPVDALPLYLRDKVALTTAERQAGALDIA